MNKPATRAAKFRGLEVVAFETRFEREMAALIEKLGGVPRVAPSVREAPLEENTAAMEFARELLAGKIDAVIFMTGVGARTLVEVLEKRHSLEEILRALRGATVVARGPKAVNALRDLGVPVTLQVPEPNTWREILQEFDGNPRGSTLKGSRIAVQEYGVSNEAFLGELRTRGAEVLRVPVYRWTLPEDLSPLRDAVRAIIEGGAHVVLFTNATQVFHLLKVAEDGGLKQPLLDGLRRCVVGSIGPTCSEALVSQGIAVDIEPAEHKMGALVHEAAARARELLHEKAKQGAAQDSGRASIRTAEPRKGAEPAPWHDSRFLRACRREPVDATPVWLMRQAGRFMKEYRDLRARVSFLDLCKNPDLVTEVTINAAEKLGVDAAIIFADLLLIVEPLGFGLEYDRGEGPVVRPALREARDVDRVREDDPLGALEYLFEAIRRTRAALNPRLPLIGFAGAPFTVASYLIEGGASKTFRHTKSLMYRDPGAWRELMERLARTLARYINAQIAAGVQAVQVFDTWVGCLGPADYRQFVAPYTRALFGALTPGVPRIHFGTETAALLEAMRDAGGDIIGLDWRVELDHAWTRLGSSVGVQGNLDPVVLYSDRNTIRERAARILDQAGGRPGHIFNLGHGILPDTPYDNVVALVEMVHELSSQSASANAGTPHRKSRAVK